MENNHTNQRVTNAQLKRDIEHLTERFREMRDELREDRERNTKRLNVVEKHVVECATLWRQHDNEHSRINGDISGIKQDIKKWSGAGGFFGAIAAIITSVFIDRGGP